MTDTEYNKGKEILIPGVLHAIVITYSLIIFCRIRRFLSFLCPSEKMSCIGKYKRNVIDLKTTTMAILYWTLFPISLKLVILSFKPLSISPEHVILVHTLYNTFGVEIFSLCFSLILNQGELPSRTQPRKTGNFYVRRPDFSPRSTTPLSLTLPEPEVETQTTKFQYISSLSRKKNMDQRQPTFGKVVTVGLGGQAE